MGQQLGTNRVEHLSLGLSSIYTVVYMVLWLLGAPTVQDVRQKNPLTFCGFITRIKISYMSKFVFKLTK